MAMWYSLLVTYFSRRGINIKGIRPPITIPIAADLIFGSSVAAI